MNTSSVQLSTLYTTDLTSTNDIFSDTFERHSENSEAIDSIDENSADRKSESDLEQNVCDISNIKIDDNSRENSTLSCSGYQLFERNENNADDENPSKEHEMTEVYIKELEIKRKDEEDTIEELVHTTNDQKLMEQEHANMRVAYGIILRFVLPLANSLVRGIRGIRDVRFLKVLQSIASSRQALTNLLAFSANTISMNLSSAQVTHRMEPLLKILKIRRSSDGLECLPDCPSSSSSCPSTPTATPLFSPFINELNNPLPQILSARLKTLVPEEPAPKCCTLNILAEPPHGTPILADIVFIHGLHGSLANTWKQGLWENDRHPIQFERPPKPPVRPPKRQLHSRPTEHVPLHKQKRARVNQTDHNDGFEKNNTHNEWDTSRDGTSFSYECGDPKDVEFSNGLEYSFPTFRLRIDDSGHLLATEADCKEKSNKNFEKKTTPKVSSNDPNYSKCWPGDWIPQDCPGVRVIALNYTTDQYLWRPLWKKKETRSNLIQRSREMAELLIEHRVGHGHPIVWVGHSKGGLFIKQIVVDAWESGRPTMAPLWRSSRGVFFYSVPHRGSHLAGIKAPFLNRSVELLETEKNNKYLLDLHRRFAGLYHLGHLKIEVFSFIELALTLMSVLYLRIVGIDSADPGFGEVCGIRLDHREICKPRSRDCILYKELVKMIKKVC